VGEGGWGFELPANVANPAAASEFLRFMSTYEAQYIFSQIYGGSPPATWGLMETDIYQGDHPVKVGLRRVVRALEDCVFFGWGYGVTSTIGTIISENLDLVREGSMNSQEAAQRIQEGCVDHLNQWLSEA
jgi:ABC-type glycerol-3-phosphate transport system substrate-binding protein